MREDVEVIPEFPLSGASVLMILPQLVNLVLLHRFSVASSPKLPFCALCDKSEPTQHKILPWLLFQFSVNYEGLISFKSEKRVLMQKIFVQSEVMEEGGYQTSTIRHGKIMFIHEILEEDVDDGTSVRVLGR
jgi:hypothetical protein